MENTTKLKIIKFSDIKQKIEAQIDPQKIGIDEQVTLFDGFINQPFCRELSGSYVLGGPTVPMIMLVGNKSGRLYFFALKALLTDLEL